MFKNHLKIAWRTLLKYKGLFAINIVGLAIGITASVIISLFVIHELSYDQYNEKADRIVRVVLRGQANGEVIKEAVTAAPVAATLQQEFPEVEKGTRLRTYGTPAVTYQNTTYRDSKFAYVDANFFEVFTLPLIKGNPINALKEPNTIVIAQEHAKKYFGEEDPIGKVLVFKDLNQEFKVTGVMKKVPENSHFHFDLFASMEGFEHAKKLTWLESNYHSYLLLNKESDYKNIEAKLPLIIKKYMGPQLQKAMGITFEEFSGKGNKIGLFLQPLSDIHLYSDFADMSNIEAGGDIKIVYIFSVIALFILLVACVNFMNLSTAAASKRAKEIGVKKVLGSSKRQLVIQFLMESLIVTLIAMVLAGLLVVIALPVFNDLSGKTLLISQIVTPKTVSLFLLFGILISMLAGSYPAFLLSSFKPIAALRNKFTNTGNSKSLRSGLVIFQFVISACLIIATLVVDQQMSFIQNKDLGYHKNHRLILKDSWMLKDDEHAFKMELLKDPRVEKVTMSGFIPAGPTNDNISSFFPDQKTDEHRRTIIYKIDEEYIPTMGMQVVQGRNFSKEFGTESNNILINETSAKIFGFGDNAVGRILTSMDNQRNTVSYTVIGVVKDFHFKSLHRPIDPLVMLNRSDSGIIIKANTADIAGLISSVEALWNNFNTGEPFSYGVLDELYNQTHSKEQKMGVILRIFALLTIFVACLGLFGLITFTAEQRYKEIGIRKVLGSSVPQIITMLSSDFLKLVLVSFLVAFPLGFYMMNMWLEDFAYRIQIQWWIFALSGIITISIAFLTIGWKSFRAASMDPVKSLRTE